MSATERVFPTFCHLVEYGTAGYQHMHRLLAFSAPLNLWAPSSLLVKEAGSIRPKRFLQYVEDGLIRVLGREPWLTDPAFRASHVRRDEAPWDRRIDDALKRILRNDERLPVEERRVVAAPPEKGMTWAQDFLAENPAEVDRWFKIFSSASKTSRSRPHCGSVAT